jgi:hypothetical protein
VPLTDEQRAMLQLLLEGGQGYEDIGSLLGIPPDEVRSRARAALREIGGADPDAQVSLSDYLLGQADPIGRADAVRHLQGDPDANALAERLVAQLRLLAPRADLPEVPAPRGRRRAPAPAAPTEPAISATAAGAPEAQASPSAGPRTPTGPGVLDRVSGKLSGLGSLSKRQTQLAVGITAALILAIVAVLVVSGGDEDSGGNECPAIDSSAAEQAGLPASSLSAPEGVEDENGCAPSGQVVITTTGNQIILQANASGLEPTNQGETYVLWLYRSDQEAVPIGQNPVDDSGNLIGAAPLTPQALLLLPAFQSIRVSRITEEQTTQIEQALRKQRKQPLAVTAFLGQPVLEGPVPELPQGAGGAGQGGAAPGAGGQGAGGAGAGQGAGGAGQ